MFSYLINKIQDAEFKTEPFRHLHIKSFLSDAHFNEIVCSTEINLTPQAGDDGLFDEMFNKGYKVIVFPGCITNKDEYIDWHKEKRGLQGQERSGLRGFRHDSAVGRTQDRHHHRAEGIP